MKAHATSAASPGLALTAQENAFSTLKPVDARHDGIKGAFSQILGGLTGDTARGSDDGTQDDGSCCISPEQPIGQPAFSFTAMSAWLSMQLAPDQTVQGNLSGVSNSGGFFASAEVIAGLLPKSSASEDGTSMQPAVEGELENGRASLFITSAASVMVLQDLTDMRGEVPAVIPVEKGSVSMAVPRMVQPGASYANDTRQGSVAAVENIQFTTYPPMPLQSSTESAFQLKDGHPPSALGLQAGAGGTLKPSIPDEALPQSDLIVAQGKTAPGQQVSSGSGAMSPEMAVLEANDARQAAALAMPEQAFASPLAAQQTYPQSPMQQLAAKIDRALIPTHIAASGIASGANTTDSIKVLTVQLEPRELGQVRLRLTLSEGVLQVRVEAQDAQTAKMLLDQSGVLQRLLGSAGYAVDSLTVQQQALPPTPNQSLENPSRHETARCIAESGHPGAGSGSQQHHAASQRNESSFDPQQQGFADETGTASGASDVRGGNGSHLRGSGIYV